MFERSRSSVSLRALWLMLACCTLALTFMVQGPRVQAQVAPDGTDSNYQAAIRDGLQALHEGRFAEAHAQFARAHELRPSARTLRGLGIAELELNEHVAAYQHLSESLTDPRRPLAELQRKEVQTTLENLRTMIGRYRVELTPIEATYLVDGATPTLDAEGNVLLARGTHTVSVTAPGYQLQERQLVVLGGEQEALTVRLEAAAAPPVEPVPAVPAVAPAVLPPASIPAAPQTSKKQSRTWAWVAIGSGAAVAITGTVLAAVGMRDRSTVEEANDGSQWSSLKGAYDRASVLIPVGWTLMAVGLAGAGAGAWGVLRPDGRERRTTLSVSPRGLHLQGRF